MRSRLLGHFDAQHRLGLAVIATGVAFFLTRGRMSTLVQIIVVWNVFCWSLLLLAWLRIIWGEAAAAARVARLQDSSRTLIFNPTRAIITTPAAWIAMVTTVSDKPQIQLARSK